MSRLASSIKLEGVDKAPDPGVDVWVDRYGYVCPAKQGKIVHIRGVGDKDYYNPVLCQQGEKKLLAFRLENRDSDWRTRDRYHPTIAFAAQNSIRQWRIINSPEAFDMLEDPIFFTVSGGTNSSVVFGGVRVEVAGDGYIPNTEFYAGPSLATIDRQPFAVIEGMKDVRLLQLPDGRFLLCRRPIGGEYHKGRITLNIIDSLEALAKIESQKLPAVAVLDSGYATDWVGANNAYILHDKQGVAWVGLLGHLGLIDKDWGKHYAVTTYKIKLEHLLDHQVQHIMPHVIATRACFENGPQKTLGLADVVFPGSLEALGKERYRLWVGLSDARIGTVVVDDPFGLRQLSDTTEKTQDNAA